jgi:hypothetical protein
MSMDVISKHENVRCQRKEIRHPIVVVNRHPSGWIDDVEVHDESLWMRDSP